MPDMLGALGGISAVALVLSRNGFRPSVFAFWLLFAIVAWMHTHGVPVLP
jgi:hypothetical protein